MQIEDNIKETENKLRQCIVDKKSDEALKQILHLLGGPFAFSEVWQHKAFFLSMQDDLMVKDTPVCCAMLAVIKMLSFDLPGARKFQKELPEKSFAEYYLWAVMPETEEQWQEGMDRVIAEFPDEIRTHQITLGRPTLYNGIWCMANFGKDFPQGEYVRKLFSRCSGERGQGMYEILMSEISYQQNDCFEALSLAVGNSYTAEQMGNISGLFVGLYIQMCVMIVTGQLQAVQYVMEKISERVRNSVCTELSQNEKALAAWCGLYDKNYPLITAWMKEWAPNEYGELCLLELFAYMVKLRVYLMQKKHYALLGLAESLRPLLGISERKMDYCEVSIIEALSLYQQGKAEEAFVLLDEVLPIAKQYRFYRLIADEGDMMYHLLEEYKKEKRFEDEKFLELLTNMSQKMGVLFPGYMEREPQKNKELTERETDVLRLFAEERTNGEIADYFQVSLNTVKYYSKNIFEKLGVKNRQKAVKAAKELGIL